VHSQSVRLHSHLKKKKKLTKNFKSTKVDIKKKSLKLKMADIVMVKIEQQEIIMGLTRVTTQSLNALIANPAMTGRSFQLEILKTCVRDISIYNRRKGTNYKVFFTTGSKIIVLTELYGAYAIGNIDYSSIPMRFNFEDFIFDYYYSAHENDIFVNNFLDEIGNRWRRENFRF
jgi:hypothetical protein